jgi:hypothetical protein
MKTLAILFTLFYFFNALAVAPYGFKGQQQSTTLYSNVLQGQNNLVTNMGGINALLETGNKNILTNPSFEHATFSTGWTNSAGTFTADTVVEVDGLKAAKLVLSSQTMSLTQSSTLYASQFADGIQGLALVRVKSDVALKVCSIQAGTVSTSNCVNVQANNKWGLYRVPMILGATSNGVSIASTGAVSGTVYIDDAFVGAVDLQGVTNSIGPWISFTPTGSFTTNTTYSGFYRQVGTDLEVTATLSFSGAPNVAGLSVNLPSGFTIDTGKAPTVIGTGRGYDPGINVYEMSIAVANSTAVSVVRKEISTTYVVNNTPANATTPFAIGNADFYSLSYKVPVTQFSNAISVYSSTNADTDWASCGLTGAAFTGFGSSVPTPALQCKRQGSDLLIKGTFQAGTTPTAVEARMALPTWNGVQLVSANSSIIPRVQLAGNLTINLANTTFFGEYVLIEASVPYVTFALQSSVANADTKATGANLSGTGNFHSINARIPIEGWQGSNIIVGSFSGLESCADTYQCTDTFSAFIDISGNVSNENVDWLNGNCSTSAGVFTCGLKTGLSGAGANLTTGMNCNITAGAATSAVTFVATEVRSSTTTQIVYGTNNTTDFAHPVYISCQKGPSDFLSKTAKAVASDQSVRSIGSTGMDIQSVHFAGATISTTCTTSPCVIHNSVGSKITSVTRTGPGDYNINGIDGIKYICTGGANASSYVGFSHRRDLSSSSFARVQFGSGVTPLDVNNSSISCLGIP